MSLYRVVKKGLLETGKRELTSALFTSGEEILFDGPPSRGLQPLDADAEVAARRAGSGANAGAISSMFAEHRRSYS